MPRARLHLPAELPRRWISWLLTVTLLEAASPATKPARWRSSVDLPEPDAPSKATTFAVGHLQTRLSSSALAPAWKRFAQALHVDGVIHRDPFDVFVDVGILFGA